MPQPGSALPHAGQRFEEAVRRRARAQADGVTEDRTPNHCSAPYSSNRSASVNPSFAARRIARSWAIWVATLVRPSAFAAPARRALAGGHPATQVPSTSWLTGYGRIAFAPDVPPGRFLRQFSG
jgi:hypothetical protein